MSEPAEIFFGETPRKVKPFRVLLVGQEICKPPSPSVRSLLAANPEFNLRAAIPPAAHLYESMRRHKPHLVLVDLAGLGHTGFSLLHQLRRKERYKPVLVLGDAHDPLFGLQVLQERANGYLAKDEVKDRLVPAMRQVLMGGLYLSAAVREGLLQHIDQVVEATMDHGNLVQYLRSQIAVCRLYGLESVQISKFLGLPMPQVAVLLKDLEEPPTANQESAPRGEVQSIHGERNTAEMQLFP